MCVCPCPLRCPTGDWSYVPVGIVVGTGVGANVKLSVGAGVIGRAVGCAVGNEVGKSVKFWARTLGIDSAVRITTDLIVRGILMILGSFSNHYHY